MIKHIPFIDSIFLTTICTVILPFFGCHQDQKKESAPNIILIVADDLGWSDLHGYGHDMVDTPHLDRLAEQGVKFTNAYASCTVCSPTRASILTGKNPVSVNITDFIPGHQYRRGPEPSEKFIVPMFNHQLNLEEITIAEKLKEKGYETASIGKWHLGGEGYFPTDQGFDINIAGGDKGLPPSYYFPYINDWFDFEIPHLPTGKDSLYLTDRLTKEALMYIDQHKDNPFFLYLPYYTVHTPWEGRPDLVKKYKRRIENMEDSIIRNPHFLAMVECLDENVGKVMKKIEKEGIIKNTLVIFASDNGGLLSRKGNEVYGSYNFPLRGGKGTHYEGGLRVPVIFHWPGKLHAGMVSEELIISSDIFPTIMEIMGIQIGYKIEGVSLWAHLSKGSSIQRETLYWHYPHYHHSTPGSVIRDGDFKLIHFYEDDHQELYNLKEDIGENEDLAEVLPGKRDELLIKLQNWLDLHEASIPDQLNPEYEGIY